MNQAQSAQEYYITGGAHYVDIKQRHGLSFLVDLLDLANLALLPSLHHNHPIVDSKIEVTFPFGREHYWRPYGLEVEHSVATAILSS
jgi:hypothetical protein